MTRPRLALTHPRLTGDVHQHWPGKRWWQKPGPWCRTKDRLGRRGAMLLVVGLTYVLVGIGEFVREPLTVNGAWHLLVPAGIRGWAWIVTGLFAAFFALSRPNRNDVTTAWWREDTSGWLALYWLPTVHILSFGYAWVLWLVTDHANFPTQGDPLAWYNAARQLPFIVVVLICSGWPDKPRKCS